MTKRGIAAAARTYASGMGEDNLIFVDEFEVRVTRRKNMKRMRMRVVPPDGHIEVSCPRTVSQHMIESFIKDQRAWIVREQEKLRDSPQVLATLADEDEIKMWRAVVSQTVPLLMEMWAPVLGVRPGKLAYRNMKSRWGSCQPATGRICINTRLALYPPECLEYVVVHELCHLREPGHTPAFWALVESCLPEWRRARDLLKA